MVRAAVIFALMSTLWATSAFALANVDRSGAGRGDAICEEARIQFSWWTEHDMQICKQIAFSVLNAIYAQKIVDESHLVKESNRVRFDIPLSRFNAITQVIARNGKSDWHPHDSMILTIPVDALGGTYQLDFIIRSGLYKPNRASGPRGTAIFYSVGVQGNFFTSPLKATGDMDETLEVLVREAKEAILKRKNAIQDVTEREARKKSLQAGRLVLQNFSIALPRDPIRLRNYQTYRSHSRRPERTANGRLALSRNQDVDSSGYATESFFLFDPVEGDVETSLNKDFHSFNRYGVRLFAERNSAIYSSANLVVERNLVTRQDQTLREFSSHGVRADHIRTWSHNNQSYISYRTFEEEHADRLEVLNVSTGEIIHSFTSSDDLPAESARVSRDGDRIIDSEFGHRIYQFDARNATLVRSFEDVIVGYNERMTEVITRSAGTIPKLKRISLSSGKAIPLAGWAHVAKMIKEKRVAGETIIDRALKASYSRDGSLMKVHIRFSDASSGRDVLSDWVGVWDIHANKLIFEFATDDHKELQDNTIGVFNRYEFDQHFLPDGRLAMARGNVLGADVHHSKFVVDYAIVDPRKGSQQRLEWSHFEKDGLDLDQDHSPLSGLKNLQFTSDGTLLTARLSGVGQWILDCQNLLD